MRWKSAARAEGDRPGRAARRGFSLIEVLVSVGILTLVTGGLASAIVISSHALPDRSSDGRAMVAVSGALERLGTDLSAAQAFVVRDAAAVEFSVADRDGDGSAEQLRYGWSGKRGDPLTVSRNGGKEQPLVAGVESFSLKYETRDVTEAKSTTASVNSGETLLASFTGWAGLTPTSTTFALSTSRYITQVFPVSWPAGATDCQITRVRCRMKQGTTASATFTAGVYLPVSSSNLAPGTIVGSVVTMTSGALPVSFGWQDFSFSDAGASSASTQLVFQLKGGSSSNTANVEYYNNALARDDGTYCYWTTNSGSTWSPTLLTANANDMPIYVYGSYTTHSTQTANLTRTLVYAVRLSLRATGQQDAVDVRVGLLNTPEAVP